MSPFLALDLLKEVFREASKVATEVLYKAKAWSPAFKCMALGSAARAFTQQNVVLARTLLNANPGFADFLCVDNAKVSMTSSATFSVQFSNAKRSMLEAEIADTSAISDKRKRATKVSALRRLAALWKQSAPFVMWAGVQDPAGNGVILRGQSMNNALASAWAVKFEKASLPREKQAAFAKKFIKPWKFKCGPPDVPVYKFVIPRLPSNAPGIDGAPYACYAACLDVSAHVLANVARSLHDGHLAPWEFNYSITVFPPKSREEGDEIEVIRTPMTVRPLGLKNCDNKIICSADNFMIRKEVAAQACRI
jgi:hypothetical protein